MQYSLEEIILRKELGWTYYEIAKDVYCFLGQFTITGLKQ